MTTRKTSETERKVFKFLNELCSSGETNMYGAIPYLTKAFPELGEDEAIDLLYTWMKNFNNEGNYNEIKLI